MKRIHGSPRRGLWAGVLLVVASAAWAAPGLSQLRVFEDANRRYAEATRPDEYEAVAARFQSILDGGVTSGAVLYNLGNCWLALGRRGRAIACYRQALRYRPRDPLLLNNLGQALVATGQPEPSKSLLDHLLFWQDWLSYREKAWAVALLASLAFLCGLLSLRYGGRARRVGWCALVLFVIASGSLAVEVVRIEFTRHGVIIRDQVTARMGNSESFAPAFNEALREGAGFVLLERRDDWVRIRLQNGLDGWVRADDAVLY